MTAPAAMRTMLAATDTTIKHMSDIGQAVMNWPIIKGNMSAPMDPATEKMAARRLLTARNCSSHSSPAAKVEAMPMPVNADPVTRAGRLEPPPAQRMIAPMAHVNKSTVRTWPAFSWAATREAMTATNLAPARHPQKTEVIMAAWRRSSASLLMVQKVDKRDPKVTSEPT